MTEGLKKIISSKSKTFLAFCFCFIFGASFASIFDWPSGYAFYCYSLSFIVLFFLIIFWHHITVRFFILCSLFFFFGAWRFLVTIPNCSDAATLCHYTGRQLTVAGWISSEPDARIADTYYVVTANNYNGKIIVKTTNYPAYLYGQAVQVRCMVKKPENMQDSTFRYDMYLAKQGIWVVCENAQIGSVIPPKKEGGLQGPGGVPESSAQILDTSQSPGATTPLSRGELLVMSKIFAFKSLVADHISRLWPEPEGSFMAGLLYGSKSGLPQSVMDDFSNTGVTHIIAVSGFNVTIIAAVLLSVLIRCGLSRRHAFWAIVITLILFVIFTGATASVVRAAIMGSVALTAQYLGRLSRMGNVLAFTAAMMVLTNPYLLLWDVGFQLSFLATMGLVYVSPVLHDNVEKVRQRVSLFPNFIIEPLIQTLSAIIATLPFILYQFDRLSLVAPLVNVLVLWSIPWLMLAGFIPLVLSFLFFPLAKFLALIAHIGMWYVLGVVQFFGEQWWSAIAVGLPWWGMAAAYGVLTYWIVQTHPEKMKNIINTNS